MQRKMTYCVILTYEKQWNNVQMFAELNISFYVRVCDEKSTIRLWRINTWCRKTIQFRGFQMLTIFNKYLPLRFWQSSKYTSATYQPMISFLYSNCIWYEKGRKTSMFCQWQLVNKAKKTKFRGFRLISM